MEIKDKNKVYNECQEHVLEMIRRITNESYNEQEKRYLMDPIYHSAIDLFTQMAFIINTDERFIAERQRVKSLALYQDMKKHLRIYGINID